MTYSNHKKGWRFCPPRKYLTRFFTLRPLANGRRNQSEYLKKCCRQMIAKCCMGLNHDSQCLIWQRKKFSNPVIWLPWQFYPFHYFLMIFTHFWKIKINLTLWSPIQISVSMNYLRFCSPKHINFLHCGLWNIPKIILRNWWAVWVWGTGHTRCRHIQSVFSRPLVMRTTLNLYHPNSSKHNCTMIMLR